MKRLVCLLGCLCGLFGRAEAANRTVCASGCQYNNVQTAIDAAVPGDVILLRAGETFIGNIVLTAKGSTSTAFITIRSDAPASSLPADGVRLVPEGRPGGNVARTALARLVGQGGSWKSVPVVRVRPGAHHYRLQFLDIDGAANLGYETLVEVGENSSNQTSTSASPHSIVIDRVYLHGHPTKGIKRGVALNSRSTDILNSYIADVMSTSDAQAIAGFNGAGPFRIVNNYLEAAAENILFGGSDPKTANLVPSDIEIRGNHVSKPLRWRSPVMQPPSRPSVSARTGGSLSAGTHYFKVVAVMSTGGDVLVSAPSAEASVSVGGSGAVALSWSGVSGADRYRVYRGTSSNGQSVYVETASASTTMVYTGSGQTSGGPQSWGTRWTAKNLLELKNAQRVTIDGNVFEHNWGGFQQGYAIVFTPKNQEGRAPWAVVKDVTFTNNVVRRIAAGINIAGYDYEASSQQGRNFRIANNVFVDMTSEYDGHGGFLLLASGPANVVVDHNTIVHEGPVLEVEGPDIPGFSYTNNLSRHNAYGIKGRDRATGTDTLNAYFPGWVFRGNVLAGGPASVYPSGNFFPTLTQFSSSFVDLSGGEYDLAAASPFNDAGTDGGDIGADMNEIAAAPGGTSVPPSDAPDEEPASQPGLPSGWLSEDVGPAGPGSASFSSGVFTVKGGGADIWGTADAFHFAYRSLSGDGTIVARVSSVAGSQAWTKVGVMIRSTTAPGSAHATMLVSAGKGLAFQRRTRDGGLSTHTYGGGGTAPRWVKVSRAGNIVTASVSTDGSAWTVVGSDTIALTADALVGLAVGSHDVNAIATGTFDNVTVAAGLSVQGGWDSYDVGKVGIPGSATESSGTFTVKGAGADVWGSADAHHFLARPLEGDGDIVARVASISGTDPWTKVGVMIRQTLDAGSAQAFMLVSVGKGVAYQRRTVTGGTSVHTSGGSGTAPRWVKLARRGSVITAYVSSNGTTWTTVSSDTFSISGVAYAGLAVTSHDASRLATGTFDNVTVTP